MLHLRLQDDLPRIPRQVRHSPVAPRRVGQGALRGRRVRPAADRAGVVVKRPEQLGLELDAPAEAAPALDDRAALPDRLARDRIYRELDDNLLVEAGAGSGKTTALVSRMVALVRKGKAPVHQIAAVTFTRKAAGELRERFQEALEEERDAEGAPEERARLDAALRDVDRAFMGTIHAFCARLLRERPLDAGVDPGFAETTPAEAKLVAGRFWSLHLERLAAEGDPILGELEDVGLQPIDLRGMYDDLRDFLDVEFPADPAAAPDPEAIARARAEVDGILDAAAALMPKEEPEKEWDDLQRRLRTVGYTRRYGRWSDDRVFLDALADLGSRTSWKVVQYKWVPNGKTGARCPGAKTIEERVNRLGASGTASRELIEQWWAHRYPIAMGFVLGAARALERHRRETGRLDFQDLLALSARLLRTHPEARRDLGERWRRILVDEFQDTDPLQAEVLFLLSSEPTDADDQPGAEADWTSAEPRAGALFVVGDPKQSIYRFRRADIALYMRVRERFRGFGHVLDLVANFRSVEPIAELVNTVFGPPEGFPWEADSLQAAFAPLMSQPRAAPRHGHGVFHYSVPPTEDKRETIAAWDAEALADWISRRIAAGRKPGDFLILTRTRPYLARYAAALEARNLPVQVSGAGVGVEEVVAELRLLLETLADPDDSAKTVAVLVGLFFGLDHDQLLEHALAGRTFDLRLARSGTGDPVEDALALLRRWALEARTRPADVTVARVADELGLLAHAAAGELGGVRAGALAFALDAVRAAGLRGDTSITAALEALDAALLEEEAEAPLEPGRSDVIRLMNLHKAKGLEAAVVVLAEPSGERDYGVDRHTERTLDGRARGWFCLSRKDERRVRTLARPRAWNEIEVAERAFKAAEDVRLLYVAATRAAEELVVARQGAKPERSPWRPFEAWLDEHGHALALAPTPPPARERLERTVESLSGEAAAAAAARRAAGAESYRFASVTSLVKHGGDAAGAVSDMDRLPALAPSLTGPGGYEWGSAVHGVLEAAARGAAGDRLRAIARSLLLELDRPARGGEPTELEALMAVVNAVRESRLWKRAAAASRRLAEVPFAVELADATWLEGVVDLAFREPDGWVLVDYKTDRGDDPAFAERRLSYRAQIARYAEAWGRLTQEPVKERLIFWTSQRKEESVA
ncbi:MAG: hypothetical protein EXR95_00575 [Gemmatimonadetes bacterium]|nr:hypothetical protein [Gemmatimonadota bacterium]